MPACSSLGLRDRDNTQQSSQKHDSKLEMKDEVYDNRETVLLELAKLSWGMENCTTCMRIILKEYTLQVELPDATIT